MAKKSKSAGTPTQGSDDTARAARKAQKDEIAAKYGKILFTSEYSLSPHLEADMAQLCGPANSEGVASLVAGILCAAIVLILMASQSYLPIAVVLVVITVIVMALSRELQGFKVRWLDKHGYNAALLDETNLYVSYATDSHVVVVRPDGTICPYPMDELKRARHDESSLVVSFGKGRVALFTRKSMGAAKFNELAASLADKVPPTVGEAIGARFNRK